MYCLIITCVEAFSSFHWNLPRRIVIGGHHVVPRRHQGRDGQGVVGQVGYGQRVLRVSWVTAYRSAWGVWNITINNVKAWSFHISLAAGVRRRRQSWYRNIVPWGHGECGEWGAIDAGEKGGAMEDPASEGEKGGARIPGEPAEEREEGPWNVKRWFVSPTEEEFTWSGEGRDCKEGEGDPRDEREDSRAPLASCGLFSSSSPSSRSSSARLLSNWPVAGTVLPSWSNLVASISWMLLKSEFKKVVRILWHKIKNRTVIFFRWSGSGWQIPALEVHLNSHTLLFPPARFTPALEQGLHLHFNKVLYSQWKYKDFRTIAAAVRVHSVPDTFSCCRLGPPCRSSASSSLGPVCTERESH